MSDLKAPDREPDYISRSGSKYWFKEMLSVGAVTGICRCLKIIDNTIVSCNEYREEPLIKEIYGAYCNFIAERELLYT